MLYIKNELKKKFVGKFINENQEYIDNIIDYLIEDKYINDKEYVEAYFHESTLLRNQSITEIKFKLLEKGIDSEFIEEYIKLNEKSLNEYEIKSALNLLKKRSNEDSEKNISYLLNKGYTIDNIRKAIEYIED